MIRDFDKTETACETFSLSQGPFCSKIKEVKSLSSTESIHSPLLTFHHFEWSQKYDDKGPSHQETSFLPTLASEMQKIVLSEKDNIYFITKLRLGTGIYSSIVKPQKSQGNAPPLIGSITTCLGELLSICWKCICWVGQDNSDSMAFWKSLTLFNSCQWWMSWKKCLLFIATFLGRAHYYLQYPLSAWGPSQANSFLILLFE